MLSGYFQFKTILWILRHSFARKLDARVGHRSSPPTGRVRSCQVGSPKSLSWVGRVGSGRVQCQKI